MTQERSLVGKGMDKASQLGDRALETAQGFRRSNIDPDLETILEKLAHPQILNDYEAVSLVLCLCTWERITLDF